MSGTDRLQEPWPRSALGAMLVTVTAALVGCAAPESESQPADLSVYQRGNGGEPGTLDPHLAEDTLAANVLAILAGIAANEGKHYRYPFNVDFIRA